MTIDRRAFAASLAATAAGSVFFPARAPADDEFRIGNKSAPFDSLGSERM